MTMPNVTNAAASPSSHALGCLPIFGPPALLKGEDDSAYNELLAQVSGALKPSDIFEEIWVREMVDLTWEAWRWRRLLAAFIETEIPKALERTLQPFIKNPPTAASRDTSFLGEIEAHTDAKDSARKLATEWAAGDQTAIERVQGMLVSSRSTMESVVAQAVASQLEKIGHFNRLIANAEARRNSLLREIERRRATFRQKLRSEVHKIEDGSVQTVESTTIVPTAAANENAA
jgi:hypothetical protein